MLAANLVLVSGYIAANLSAQETQRADTRTAGRGRAAISVREGYLSAVQGRARSELPIGIFDSGTGGLAVMEEILRLDEFDNASRQPLRGGDGRRDFAAERFVFLADQANMPYGNYPAAGKRGLLVDLILRDAIFLLSCPYARTADEPQPSGTKLPVKTIVIACNTATAHGRNDIETLISQAEIDVNVVNVIDAGAHGALELARGAGDVTIGVIATAGTVSSGAYPAALQRLAGQYGIGLATVVQQGSIGLAGAIDGLPNFIDPAARSPRTDYRGPSLVNEAARIDAAILPRFAFEFGNHHMLWVGDPARPNALQINSVENYVAYEVVSLLETLRARPGVRPLSAVILGCTHFPYYADVFRAELQRLRDYQEGGRYVYRPLLAERVDLIDPAQVTARQLYLRLSATAKSRRGEQASAQDAASFFITVPNRQQPGVQLDAAGNFTYDYKYGREEGHNGYDVRSVPLTPDRLDRASAERLRHQLPAVWQLLQSFGSQQPVH